MKVWHYCESLGEAEYSGYVMEYDRTVCHKWHGGFESLGVPGEAIEQTRRNLKEIVRLRNEQVRLAEGVGDGG